MRMHLGCVAVLAWLSLSCATKPPPAIPPELLVCPTQGSTTPFTDANGSGRAEDTDGKPGIDRKFYDTGARAPRVELNTDGDPNGVMDLDIQYESEPGTLTWERLPRSEDLGAQSPGSTPSPAELYAPDLLRVVPAILLRADRRCLERQDVSAYMGSLRGRMYGRWETGTAHYGTNLVLNFAIAKSGELLGVCLVKDSDPSLGAQGVRALLLSAPFPPLRGNLECLAGRRIKGTFMVR